MGNLFSRQTPAPAQRVETAAPRRNPRRPPPANQQPGTSRLSEQPTAKDVETYSQELSDISEYLGNLDKLTAGDFVSHKVAGEALDLDDGSMDSYLEVLSMKADQVSGIRKFLQAHPDISGADLLRDLLDDVEPKCRDMRDKLSRLRSVLVMKTSKCAAASGRTQASSGSDQAGPSGAGSSTPVGSSGLSGATPVGPSGLGSATPFAAPAGSSQPSQTGSDHGRQSPTSLESGAHGFPSSLGGGSEEEEDSESEEEEELRTAEEEDLSFRRKSAGQGQIDMEGLEEWQNQNLTKDEKLLKVKRSKNLLDQMVPWYKQQRSKTLKRKFSVHFVGEDGMDMGALSREFFFIVFEAVIRDQFKSQRFMEGQRGHLLPNALTDCRLFAYLGRMIVHAIINGCRGMPGLSPAIVHYLVSGKSLKELEYCHPPLHIDDVADPQLKQLLQKYENGEGFTELEEDAWMNWMTDSNCSINWRSFVNRHIVIQQLLLHYVFMKRVRQIQALEEGIDTLGLRQFLVNNATKENISAVFPSDDSTSYSPDIVAAIIATRGDVFDPNVFELFQQFMQDLQNGKIADFRLCDLIQFATSSPYLPETLVVSFSPDITIPTAHACYSEITLPVAHQTYREFREAMLTALHNGLTGFQLQ